MGFVMIPERLVDLCCGFTSSNCLGIGSFRCGLGAIGSGLRALSGGSCTIGSCLSLLCGSLALLCQCQSLIRRRLSAFNGFDSGATAEQESRGGACCNKLAIDVHYAILPKYSFMYNAPRTAERARLLSLNC